VTTSGVPAPAGRLGPAAASGRPGSGASGDPRRLGARLRGAIAGEVHVDLGTRALYTSDASNYRILPAAVVAPRTIDDLAAAVAVARELGLSVTMRGAGTSLAGNAIGPGIVVDVSRHLARIVDIDPASGTAVVEPGVVLDDLNAAAADHGLRFGPDPSTHSRATIGGMIGNDACGSHSVRWGTTAENTLGLTVVTAGGRTVPIGPSGAGLPGDLELGLRSLVATDFDLIRRELPPWPRRVSGYALDWLLPERGFEVARALVGTEGTCAIVAGATVRLVRPPLARTLLVIGFADDVAAASAVVPLLAERPLTIESLSDQMMLGGRHATPELPPGHAWLLVETGGGVAAEATDHAVRLAATLGLGVRDASVRHLADEGAQRALWRVREDGAGRSSRLPDGTPAWPGFEDAAVPPERLPAYLVELKSLLREHDLGGIVYGHFGEGCIHLRVAFGLDRPGGAERLGSFMRAGADLVVAHGGSLSGEHGDGRARSELLVRQYGPALIRAFERFKAVWDPGDLLNPGIIVAPDPITAALRRPAPTLLAPDARLAFANDRGDLRSAIERCIGVGKCIGHGGTTLMCPSYQATREERHGTRGRARLLQEMLAGSLAEEGWRSTTVRDALDLCLACKGCLDECPTGVDMASYKSEFLDHHYAGRIRPRAHYSLGWLPTWLRLARRTPRLVNATMRFGPTRRVFAFVAGLEPDRAIPPLARTTFVRSYRPAPPLDRSRGRVVLWPDTFNDHMAPDVAHAAVRVIRAAGFDVTVPAGRICCGLTWITTGQLDHARRVLRTTLEAPELAGEEPIVVLEPSCATALRRDLTELLPGDPRAASVARRVTTLAELLDGVGFAPAGAVAQDALVQPHCHQQAVLGTEPDLRVMGRAGIVPSRVLSGCCGLAGDFGATAGHGRISRAVAELDLLPALAATPAEQPVLADGFSCRTQIGFLTGRRASHLAEVLAARLDEPPRPTIGRE
jgi:FAD/FMN-containing dehydrogenase/Fe-S oxidoreductase